MAKDRQSWQEWAAARGYRMACADPGMLAGIRSALERRRERGEIDEAFYREHLAGFPWLADLGARRPRTLIVLAVPRPAHVLVFETAEGPLEALVPPTYHQYSPTGARIGEELWLDLLGDEFRLWALPAPLKPVAASLGLAWYGRNNVTYVKGLGSYHQLVGFLTDAALGPPADPVEPAPMPACKRCVACREACPTGAIVEDRFLLRAERCLTLLNEMPGEWPDWLPISAHHCLVGCLACQRACPVNKGKLRQFTLAGRFGLEETACILDPEGARSPLWDGIVRKLAAAGLSGYAAVIGRNLRALASARGS